MVKGRGGRGKKLIGGRGRRGREKLVGEGEGGKGKKLIGEGGGRGHLPPVGWLGGGRAVIFVWLVDRAWSSLGWYFKFTGRVVIFTRLVLGGRATHLSSLFPPLLQLLPGCEHHGFGSDGYWGCYVRHMGTSYIHPCGTAKMGPPEDPMSVLDENLKYVKEWQQ